MKQVNEEFLTPGEAAAILKTDTKLLGYYSKPYGARVALLHPARTPGGHRRYRRAEVEQLAADLGGQPLSAGRTAPISSPR